MILFKRVDSSMMTLEMDSDGLSFGIFFFNSSAELRIIPKGFLISWEIPATISPSEDNLSALLGVFDADTTGRLGNR